MDERLAEFDKAGFAVVAGVLAAAQCDDLVGEVERRGDAAGSRTLLAEPWCGRLAGLLRDRSLLRPYVPPDFVAVQCTLFEKSPTRNWLVALHQDLSIPVSQRVESGEVSGWSEKEGLLFVQPPRSVLEQLLAVRLHLDDCGQENGALRIVPGSHRAGRLTQEQTDRLRETQGELLTDVGRGGVLLMRPLLLHASSKASAPSPRRVLHFVFGPPSLPAGLQWHQAV